MIEPATRIPPADKTIEVTDQYIAAVNLNRRIITAAQLAQQSLYEMCMGFKEMRDSKLYKELGYSDFGEYCEQETGFKRSQAYNYIAIAEKLPADFVQSTGQIGVQKMYLLSRISEEERSEITNNTDLENTTVKALEQQIKELRAEKDKAVADKSAAEAQTSVQADRAAALEKTRAALSEQIADLRTQIRELENRPIEAAVEYRMPEDAVSLDAYQKLAEEFDTERQQLEGDLITEKRRAHSEKAELESKLFELQKQYDALKAEPQQTAAPDTAEVFKAYFKTAYDALNRLVEYTKSQNNADYRARTEKLIDTVKASM